jgi:hypothetical protein
MAIGRGPRINIDSSFNDRGINDAQRSMNHLGTTGDKVFGGLSKRALKFAGATTAVGAVGAGLFSVFKTGVQELKEAEEAAAQVENRIKATGQAAGLTAQQVLALGDALEKKTGIDGDQINAANALLL